MYSDSSLSHFLYLELIQKSGGGGGEAVEAFLKEAQLIRNYPVYKFSRDDKALDLVQRDH